jgi:hypothetical protein
VGFEVVISVEMMEVAEFPTNFPTPVNQTLIYPVPPPSISLVEVREYNYRLDIRDMKLNNDRVKLVLPVLNLHTSIDFHLLIRKQHIASASI